MSREHLLNGNHRIINDIDYKVPHGKQDRGNPEEVNIKIYYKEELITSKQKKKK